jgi:predicted GH43/DUF377 family glycosyl hydrolase
MHWGAAMSHKHGKVAILIAVVVSVSMNLPTLGTSFVSSQGAGTAEAAFRPYEANPVITTGEVGEWDFGFVSDGKVLYANGLFHMFYIGGDEYRIEPWAIGYAFSEDGLHWDKYERNPILELDGSIARHGANVAVPLFEDNTWILYISLRSDGGLDQSVLRATARHPTGPWTISEEPTLVANSGRWDDSLIPDSVVRVLDEYVLFYTGRHAASDVPASVGMATSPDGINWVKFNSPETMAEELQESDPIFTLGEEGSWDESSTMAGCAYWSEAGWEMFYSGLSSVDSKPYNGLNIGYVTSEDGINWIRQFDNPILTPGENRWINSVVVVDGTYYLYYTIYPSEGLVLEIGVATGTIARGETAE